MNENIEIDDVWVAASGESFGVLVVGRDKNNDVIVRDLQTGEYRDIDPFKITYRYKKVGNISWLKHEY